MGRWLFSCFFLIGLPNLPAQEQTISGEVRAKRSGQTVTGAILRIEGSSPETGTDAKGKFEFTTDIKGRRILVIMAADFNPRRIPIEINTEALKLGIIYLDRDISRERSDNLVTLTESDLSREEDDVASAGLLQATRDIFLSRAAFDFGQAFFRVRGYDARNGKVFINGMSMNKLADGRPQWNNWGGLNDITRNQGFSYGLQGSGHAFGGLLGTTNIDTRPSGQRPGMRITSSASNRTYTGRLLATYNSGKQKNGIAYALSASRRWALQGYIDGTLYDAYSVYGGLEYECNEKNSIGLTAILASNRRGRSSAITEEVFQLEGNTYNPYWGYQRGELRNSRERSIREPILILNHYYRSDKLRLSTGISYQFGNHSRSRLGYYNAPNPDPTYYRYLPSFYINSPIGANFINAQAAKGGFLKHPQLNWERIYVANTRDALNGKAAYVLYDDIVEDATLTLSSVANFRMTDHWSFDFGLSYKNLSSDNFASITDLLGAQFHEDTDPFSDTINDVNGDNFKRVGEVFNYNYKIVASVFEGFAQCKVTLNSWDAFLATTYSNTSYYRQGLFLNERFPDNSLGKSNKVLFSNFGIKGGYTFKFSGRHWLSANALFLTQAPFFQNVFINPREHNEVVAAIRSEKLSSADLNYFIRLPDLTGRLTGFYTRFQDESDINFFFVDSGVGSDFVQEVITDLDKLHMGVELGLEYQISSSVKLSFAGAVGKYLFASDPDLSINFVPIATGTAEADEDVITSEGNIDLGVATIKDLKLAQGPQKALAFGVEYRDPKYWWVGLTTNYLANNYANISTIGRTLSFYLDPETGQPFPEATRDNVNKLLEQKRLDDFYLLNLVGGKSWLISGKYISVFASVNNVFDAVFRTGGYEQSRNGNYGQLSRDNLSGSPSFAPKYWYGYGRTYFLNLTVNF